jgi:hypothetical protein
MENRELTIDDLASPVGEGMQSEVQPAMSYFAEGGEVEQGLFSQQIPQRPQMQAVMPQQRLKRTAAEMLQRVPQAQMGTMRFAPLNMPGIAGRPIQRFADGGEVDELTSEERAMIANQMNAGAPTENLFGANLTAPGPAPIPSFETNVPTFSPQYTPPTGPVATGQTADILGQYPQATTGAAGTVSPPGMARSLYEQLSPATLSAPSATFNVGTFAPTTPTLEKPVPLSREEAILRQPKLVRYEPDIKYGGLTTFKGPVATSPYTGGTDTGTTTPGQTVAPGILWETIGFKSPVEGATYSPGTSLWYNAQTGQSVFTPSGGFQAPGEGWTEIPNFSPGGIYGQDTLTGGAGTDTTTMIDWKDSAKFATGQFGTPADRPKVTNLADVFTLYAGAELDPKTAKNFQNSKYGWDKNTQSFNVTPTSANAILSTKTFKSVAGKTVDQILAEAGYTVGGKATTGTNISTADRNNYVNMLTSGTADIFRVANLITSPLRMSGTLNVSAQTTPTLSRIYTNAGVIPTAAPAATTTATTSAATTPATKGKVYSTTSPGTFTVGGKTFQGRPPGSSGRSYPNIPSSAGGFKRKAEGSGPEGEYADPVAAIRERQRARRESGTMDQGSARDRLKKFLGGEDLTPVQEFAEGGAVGSISGLKAKQLAQKRGLRPEDFGAPAGSWTNQALADALGMTITKGAGGRALATPTSMQPAKTAQDVLSQYGKMGQTDFSMLASPVSYLTPKGKAEYQTSQPSRLAQLQAMGAGLDITPEQIGAAYQSGYGTAADRYNEYLRWKNKGSGGIQGFLEKATIPITKAAFAYLGGNALGSALNLGSGASALAPGSVPVATAPVMVPGTQIPLSTAANVGRTAYSVSRSNNPEQSLVNAAFQYGTGGRSLPSRWQDLSVIQDVGKKVGLNLGQPKFGPNVKTPDIVPQSFAHGGAVHRAEGSPVTAEGYVLEPTFGERMGANVSDFLMSAGIKGADLIPADKSKMSAAHKLYLDTFGVKENRAPVTKEYFNQEEMDALADLISRKGGKKGSMSYKDYKALLGDRPIKQYPLTSGRLDPYISLSKSLGQFNYEYDPKTDSYKIIDEYDFNPLTSKRGVRSDSDFIGDYISDDNTLMDKLRLYAGRKLPPGTGRKVDLAVPAKKPVKRADGSPVYGEMPDTGGITPDTMAALLNRRGVSAGEVLRTLKDIYGQGASNVESGLRGSVAAIPGSVGDIESIFRDSDKTRKFATTEEVLRDYMPGRMTKPTKEAAGFEEVGTYLPLPIPAGTATKVAKGAKTGAKKALEELGPTAGRMAERQLQKAGLGPMYAVKPKGGTFFPPEYGSRMDDYLNDIVKGLSSSETLAGKDAKTVADFIRTKGRKYLTTAYGTSDDPLRAALLEGRLPRYGSDKERFRSYLMKAAESGDPEALQDLEKAYDQATGIRAISYVPPDMEGTAYAVSGKADRGMRERMAAEGVEPELMNPDYPTPTKMDQLLSEYSTPARKELARLMVSAGSKIDDPAIEAKRREAFLKELKGSEQSLLYAAEKGEPIYDVMGTYTDFMNARNVAQGIASIPVGELGRMSFPEAVIKGAQNMRFKRDWEAVIDNAKAGKPVPKEIYFQGTNPVYELSKDQKWVRIMTPDAVELEGAAMRHSIGGYKTSSSYNLGGKPAFESGLARVFSLRNEKGIPQVTVESKFTDDKGLEITQIKSKFNSMPTPEEKKALFELFDNLGPTSFKSDTYSSTRTGDRLEEAKTVDWGNEYQDYLKYKNKGEE